MARTAAGGHGACTELPAGLVGMGGNCPNATNWCCKTLVDPGCCIPYWAIGTVAGGLLIMLVLILVLSICLCRAKRRVKKLVASKGGADSQDQPDVQYASLQNLGTIRAGGEGREAPAPHHSDYASVAELKEEGGGGTGQPEGGTDPGDVVRDPQEEVSLPPQL